MKYQYRIILFVVIYLAAIVLANFSVLWFGPVSTPINAFLLIGLDLTMRDSLHDYWRGKSLWLKMFILILSGSAITFIINQNAMQIAIASSIAFCAAGLADALLYTILFRKRFLVRSNGSNVAGALTDSILFPTLAFGQLLPWIILGQFVAKVFGGFIWSLILNTRQKQRVNE